jgi:outer membrane putative beta-barrel porin/alpha-amylase
MSVNVKRFLVGIVGSIALVAAAAPVSAQSRPLVTEDPETVPAGNILFEAGVDFLQDVYYPASGLGGRLWRVGTFGFSFGVSSLAEIQIDGGFRNFLNIETFTPAPLSGMLDLEDDTTSDFEDLTIGAKIRFMSETPQRPAMAVRFSTRLPNATNENGLGLDTTDFNFGLAIGKTVQSVRVVGTVGLGILGDPTRGDRQNDVLNYGGSVARAVASGVEIVGEINGRASLRSGTPPVGTESHSMMRVGARFTKGPIRGDGALLIGVLENDPTWGFTGGITWVFRAFTVQ